MSKDGRRRVPVRTAGSGKKGPLQVWVENGFEGFIDERLATLIATLWGRDIWTLACSQGTSTTDGYITFGLVADAAEFLDLTCPGARMFSSRFAPRGRKFLGRGRERRALHRGWRFEATPVDVSDTSEEADTGFDFSVTAHFPQRDIPRITRAAKKTVKQLEQASSKLSSIVQTERDLRTA